MISFRDMTPEELTEFLLKEKLVDKAHVEKFLSEDIDGYILLGMSASDLISHLGFTFGKATRLVSWLKSKSALASPIAIPMQPVQAPVQQLGQQPVQALAQQPGQQPVQQPVQPVQIPVRQPIQQPSQHPRTSGIETEMALEQVPLVLKTPCSSNSSQRGSTGRRLPKLPLDPVTNIDDLKSRVFHKKPAGEYTNMWGKGYLQSYHPRAHATHNKNVERMKEFFADVYNPVVANAWISNFKGDKKSYTSTLQFIESCLPEIEPLILIIKGVSMSIQWEAEDIMRGWFLDHKKHGIKNQRLEQIAAIKMENEAFLGFIPTVHMDDDGDIDDNNKDNGEKRKWSDADFREVSLSMDIPQPSELDNFHISGLSTREGSKTFLKEGSQSSNGSAYSDNQKEKPSTMITTCSQDNKRHNKTLLVVGEVEDTALITPGANKELFGEDPSSMCMSQGGLRLDQCTDNPSFPDLSQTNEPSGGTGDTQIISYDEEDVEFNSAPALCAMPGLKRHRSESSISDTSTDAHSPNPSMTSTETDDSAKLKHPKRYLHQFYDDRPQEVPRATRSELPRETRGSIGCPKYLGFGNIDSNLPPVKSAELATKMPKLKSIRSSKNDGKENIFLASILPSKKGNSDEILSGPVQALRIDALEEDSKLTIAFKAMKLPSKKEVRPQLKSFMAAQNRRVQLFNEHALSSCRKPPPFYGHANMEVPALLDLLVKWALEFKVNIVNAPKPINGKIRLFAHHIEDK